MLVSLIRKDHKMFLNPLVSGKHYNGQQSTLSLKISNFSNLRIENKLIFLLVNICYHGTVMVHISQVHFTSQKQVHTAIKDELKHASFGRITVTLQSIVRRFSIGRFSFHFLL